MRRGSARLHYVKYGAPLARLSAGVRVNKCKDITVNFRVNRVLSRRLSAVSRPSSRMPALSQCESAAVASSTCVRLVFLALANARGTRKATDTRAGPRIRAQDPYNPIGTCTAHAHTCPLRGPSSLIAGTCVPRGLACYRAFLRCSSLHSMRRTRTPLQRRALQRGRPKTRAERGQRSRRCW